MGHAVKPAVIGNWKMNGLGASVAELTAVAEALKTAPPAGLAMICPPATLIAPFAAAAQGTAVAIGGQDCHTSDSGAHTGDIAAPMLKDAGATAVIVGHSERRTDHGETSEVVRAKAERALAHGLTAIICIGETEAERDSAQTLAVLSDQLATSLPEGADPETVIVAYEPVWAIGTGRTPTPEQIREAHAHIRDRLTTRLGEPGNGIRVLYGGSVKPANAAEIFAIANVNGGLIGGASLKAQDFLAIIGAATEG